MAKISEYLKIGEAAAYLGMHTDTLRRWDRAGKLEARRYPANRFRLYLRSDLDGFLRQLGAGDTASPTPPSVRSTHTRRIDRQIEATKGRHADPVGARCGRR